MTGPAYFDNHATTPLDPRVLEAMMPYLEGRHGNASSTDHIYGREAAEAVEAARAKVAKAVGARPGEIVFTSGATESDNLALAGAMRRHSGNGRRLVTCVTEHKAVLDAARRLEGGGARVTYLPVDAYGEVDMGGLRSAVSDGAALVSIMAANNEVGTIADLREIGRIAHERGALLHTDAAQAVGHIPVDVEAMGIDLMSISAHKMCGPKGAGALYVRGSGPRVQLEPLAHGGGQERGLRPGTLNVPAIVGLGRAAEIAVAEMGSEEERFRGWSGRIVRSLAGAGARLNGHPERRLAHNVSLRFPGVEGKAIINLVSDRLAISAGSACTTESVEPSHVLLALGLTEEEAHESVRIGMGRFNTEEEVGILVDVMADAAASLARISASPRTGAG